MCSLEQASRIAELLYVQDLIRPLRTGPNDHTYWYHKAERLLEQAPYMLVETQVTSDIQWLRQQNK